MILSLFLVYHKSTKKVLDTSPLLHEAHSSASSEAQKSVSPIKNKTVDNKDVDDAEESTRFETSLIIMSLLAIPVLCLVVITIVVRLKRRGKFSFLSFPTKEVIQTISL